MHPSISDILYLTVVVGIDVSFSSIKLKVLKL